MSYNTTSNEGTTTSVDTTATSLASRPLPTLRGIHLTKSTVYSNVETINNRNCQGQRSTTEELELVQRQIEDVFTGREDFVEGAELTQVLLVADEMSKRGNVV